MLSILLGHSYFLRRDHKQLERAKPYPPLATLQVATMLRRLGHGVRLFDAMLSEDVGEYVQELARERPQVVVIYEDNYNFLSKMCLAAMRAAALEMIVVARGAGARVIVAGSDASDAPEAYLRAGADVVLLAEGLEPLEALVSRLDGRPDVSVADLVHGLSGIASQPTASAASPAAQPRRVVRRRQIEPPSPAWDLVDIERYRTVWRQTHGYFSLNMAASRGCSFRCAWCAKPIWGNQYLQRSAADVAGEMTQLKRLFAPDHIWFADDIFGFRADWVEEFGLAVRASHGSIPFTIQTRADLVTERMASALRDAGCHEVWLGAESGSQRVLDAMRKGTTVPQIHAARERLRLAGIRVGFFIQLGYLGEELEDILATRRLIEIARPDDVGVSVAYPLPGTPFHELVKAQLREEPHWQESGELAMMYPGTYTTAFYREVRDLLHAEVEATSPNARSAVSCRWQRLLETEGRFRHSRPLLSRRAESPPAGLSAAT